MMTASEGRSVFYKELTLLQLRSFIAAARLGSLSGAARALDIAQPTVWKQIHALEEMFGRPLIETSARGCRLTAEGVALERLVQPIVGDIEGLQKRFEETLGHSKGELRIGASPRVVDEDLPPCIAAFKRQEPKVKVSLVSGTNHEIPGLVLAGKCELGYTDRASISEDPALLMETVYELDILLVAPQDHPLVRRKQIDPSAISGHPMVTAPGAIKSSRVNARFKEYDVFATPASVEAHSAAGIRRYVKMGFGVGLIGSLLSQDLKKTLKAEGLVARSMGGVFGRVPIVCVRKKASALGQHHRVFGSLVRRILKART